MLNSFLLRSKKMNCSNCPLNPNNTGFDADCFKKIPLNFRDLYLCQKHSKNLANQGLARLCPMDLWVLTFIGTSDTFSKKHVLTTFSRLVEGGHSELLCHLFQNAPPDTRKKLWLQMIKNYPKRLYLFNQIIEKNELPPLAKAIMPANLHQYSYMMLFAI